MARFDFYSWKRSKFQNTSFVHILEQDGSYFFLETSGIKSDLINLYNLYIIHHHNHHHNRHNHDFHHNLPIIICHHQYRSRLHRQSASTRPSPVTSFFSPASFLDRNNINNNNNDGELKHNTTNNVHQGDDGDIASDLNKTSNLNTSPLLSTSANVVMTSAAAAAAMTPTILMRQIENHIQQHGPRNVDISMAEYCLTQWAEKARHSGNRASIRKLRRMSKTGSRTSPVKIYATILCSEEEDDDAESGSMARTATSSLRKPGRRMVKMFVHDKDEDDEDANENHDVNGMKIEQQLNKKEQMEDRREEAVASASWKMQDGSTIMVAQLVLKAIAHLALSADGGTAEMVVAKPAVNSASASLKASTCRLNESEMNVGLVF